MMPVTSVSLIHKFTRSGYLFITILAMLLGGGLHLGCGDKPEVVEEDGVLFSSKAMWPSTLNDFLLFKKASIQNVTLSKNDTGGLIIMTTEAPSKKIHRYYEQEFKKRNWRILVNTNRPSEGQAKLMEYPDLAKQAGLDPGDEQLPGKNFILIAEGKMPATAELTTVTVSVISKLKKSEIRFFYKKVPAGIKAFDLN